MKRPLYIFAALACMTIPVSAQDSMLPYLDDRSTAQTLLQSYYNAINQFEYARAWSYWEAPNRAYETYDNFVPAFEKIETIKILTGAIQAEGAAGSTYYSVPIALEITDRSGNIKIEAGCYLMRLAQPSIQEPPFTPLHIEKMDLKPVATPFGDSVPDTCAF